jgi:tetratricopeptide (TPR) repeat protein
MFRRASILSPDDQTIREHLAMALFHDKQYAESADLLSGLIAGGKGTHRPDLEMTLGECQLQIGKPDDAAATFQQASEALPESALAWLGLARADLQLNKLHQAENALKQSLAIVETNSQSHLLMGYINLRENHLDDACAAFTRASELDPTDTVSRCMVGLTLNRLGRPHEAEQWYQKALKINPSDDMATQLMANLDVNN